MQLIKHRKKIVSTFILAGFITILGFTSANSGSNEPKVDQNTFNDYWYAGEAEITRYELQQARYGQIRKGDAVLIFVTEPFLKDKQVKSDRGDDPDAVSVLKLNATKKFYTGIYPYSIMTSVFTPVKYDEMQTLKVSFSAQEWCGHVFMQLNNRDDKFHALLRSYFQSEGDEEFKLDKTLLENEVFTRLRLNPEALPTGDIDIIPTLEHARLRHHPLKVEKATAKFSTTTDKKLSDQELRVYTIDYKSMKRTLRVKFEKEFPFRILAWEEIQPSGFGPGAEMTTTSAVRTHSVKTDYWNKNGNSDVNWREKLGLIY